MTWTGAAGAAVHIPVKEGPFFEDATVQDLSFFGPDRVVDEVLTLRAFFVPGEIPSGVRRAFDSCDLVICKGTGNFEGLKDETRGKNTIFMLKIKCGPIARKLGLSVGSFAVHLDG